jgi:mRNA-degrading endonuclease YafQ of YafQ-DinJ toxin-antitoxin module
MIDAVWDQGFKKSYRKRIHRYPQLKNQFREKMAQFLEQPFDPQLRTHFYKPIFSWMEDILR